MSAFGNITCPYCNKNYYGEDLHSCDIDSMKDRIDTLNEKLRFVKVGLEKISELSVLNYSNAIKCAEKTLELVEYNNKLIEKIT